MRVRVGVDAAAAQSVQTQVGHRPHRTRGTHEAAEPLARQRRVEPDPGLHRRRAVRPAAVERQEERNPAHEMRRDDGQESTALLVRLAHETDVAQPQVTEPAVDQLRRRARRGAAEVAAVDERDGEPVPRRRRCDSRADDAAADHEQVEALGREPLAEDVTGRYVHSGFVHAFRPCSSSTSSRPYAEAGRASRAATIRPSSLSSRISPRSG